VKTPSNSRILILLGAAATVLAACAGPPPHDGGRSADAGNAACMTAANAMTFRSQGGRSGVPAAGASVPSCGPAKDGQTSIAMTLPATPSSAP
jgi:ABC-type glycerol-3-phosphate transport system substrate-binding protein